MEIPASPDAISSARAAVRRFTERYGVGDPGAVALAVSEAITNAVMHAYRGGYTGPDTLAWDNRIGLGFYFRWFLGPK